MWDRIEITNYRCFREASAPLRPLTVCVGANDTGKSNFLRALRALALDAVFPFEPFRTAGKNDPHGESLLIAGTRQHKIKRGSTRSQGPSLRATLFDLPSRGPTLAGEGLQDKEGAPEILGNGDRVAALVDYLLRRDRQAFDRFVRAACAHIPGAVDLHVIAPSPSARSLALKIDSGAIFDAEELSAGVRLMLFFLAIAHHPSPPELILLEEPEKGVHPRRLAGL